MKKLINKNILSTNIFIKDNSKQMLFITLFTLGVTIGSFSLALTGEKATMIVPVIRSYFNENTSLSLMQLFSRNIVSNLLYLGCLYLGGLCAVGLPFIVIIPFLKGISLGMIISYKYIFNSIKGFLYHFVILLIPVSLTVCILCYAYVEGICMSLNVSNGIMNGQPRQLKYTLSFTTFTKRFLLFCLASIFVSFLEAILCFLFSKYL